MYSFHSTKWMWLISNKKTHLYYMKNIVSPVVFISHFHTATSSDINSWSQNRINQLKIRVQEQNQQPSRRTVKVQNGESETEHTEMDFEGTLKPLANISLSKYRRDLQVQKQQSLKMIKVRFCAVLFSRFAGRQVITERKTICEVE